MRTGRFLALVGISVAAVVPTAVAAQANPSHGASAVAQAGDAEGYAEEVRVEVFDETRPVGHVDVSARAPEALRKGDRSTAAADGEVHEIVNNGPVGDRVDIVFVGDGYTEAELADYHTDVKEKWKDITGIEPYSSHEELFNVWAVDAVSQDSGVSGDPTADVVKNTALASHFYCDNTERLLCVDLPRVESYAGNAPAADLVVVVSNSEKYGGAGYSGVNSPVGYDGVATLSSSHADSGQIAIHETGHSLGLLADEYWYEEDHYDGPETQDVNTSVHSADEMARDQLKWHRWLGEESPDGGTVGAYEGAAYHATGLNRPTDNSMMRTLGREFNLPGREAMVAGFYRYANELSTDRNTQKALDAIRDPKLRQLVTTG